MNPKALFVPPYICRLYPFSLKLYVLFFEKIYTLGGDKFISQLIPQLLGSEISCEKELKSIILPVDISVDPTQDKLFRKKAWLKDSKTLKNTIHEKTFDAMWALAKAISPYGDDPWDGEIIATIACKPTAGIVNFFFHKLYTVYHICELHNASYITVEPWDIENIRTFAPSVLSMEGVLFKNILDTQIPSVAEVSWSDILELRRNKYLELFQRWLTGITLERKSGSIEELTKELNNKIVNQLWESLSLLNIKPVETGFLATLGNIPTPIGINPISVVKAVQDTWRARNSRKKFGWLLFLHDIFSIAINKKIRKDLVQYSGELFDSSLPIYGYISATNGKIYHRSWCNYAKRIRRHNIVTWRWEMDAQSKNLEPCLQCLVKYREAESQHYKNADYNECKRHGA